MLQMRRYRPEDNAAVKALHFAGLAQMHSGADRADTAFFDADLDDIEGHYLNDRGEFLLGFDGGGLAVMGALRPKTATLGEIKRIRVRQDCQQRGYGKMMVLQLEARAAALGYQELVLDTLENNTRAQKLFESCGFTEDSRGMRGKHHLIYYTKHL
jgi:ribosomal protein S18 acetylase RimI-like enzyme